VKKDPEIANAPKVSVIIATYNYSTVLRYAIRSVLWQTFRDFELIVVGDELQSQANRTHLP
jgi:glycosyltransferase involved in cell wall biosynthesis